MTSPRVLRIVAAVALLAGSAMPAVAQSRPITEQDLFSFVWVADPQMSPDGSQVAMGGDLFSTSVPALSLIEAVGVLIALFVLIVTFRSVAVAWFPLISAIIGVGLAVALIYFSTAFASISSTTPMLAIMLGLAVGIDYALFIVARHQDQVRTGIVPEESAARATGTAGSAVVFAGVTVLIALVGLGFAGIPFLTTMGIAAAVAVAIAVVVAVKGIGRFSELSEPESRERFIVGTLASLLWACVLGALLRLAIW